MKRAGFSLVFGRLFLTIFLFSAAAPAFCGVRLTKVVAGMDGYIRGERWIPVVFEAQGTGASFQGTIEVSRGETVFRKSIDLSAGSQKRIELLVYQTNYYEPLEYRVLDDTGHIVAKDRIDTRVLNYQDNLILVLSSSEYNHQFLNGVQNPWGGKTFVSYMNPSDSYTEPIAYSGADAVALGNISLTELTPSQRKALLLYAATGGTLICSPVTHLSVLQDPAIRRVLPAISAELSLLSHGEFLVSRWTARSTDPFPALTIPIQQVRPAPSDNVLVTQPPDLTIVSSSPFFKGNIVYFAFDYTRMPEAVSAIFPQYWNDLIYPAAAGPPAFGMPSRWKLEEMIAPQKFLYDIPGLKLPDVKLFALFFFAYLIAIGPLQYFILSRLKKNALLWTTFPLIIIVFTGAALGYSKVRRTTDQRIRHVQVLEAFPELDMQQKYQCFGTALSDSGKFTYQALPENSFMTKSGRQPLTYLPEPFTLAEDLPHSIVGENVKTWTYRTFDAIGVESMKFPVELTAEFHNSTITGTVRNAGRSTLTNTMFVYDSKNSAPIGEIRSGSSKTFSIELNNLSPPPYSALDLQRLLDLRGLSLSNPHFLYGEMHDAPGEVVINGKNRATDNLQYFGVFVNLHGTAPLNAWPVDYGQQSPYR